MNDWELESLFDLMCNLEGFNMKTQAADALSCRPNTKEYTVHLRNILLDAQNGI